MAILTKKLSQVLYVGSSALTLANLSTGVKNAIKLIRKVNAAGTGYLSFNPASGVNSLTTAPARTDDLFGQYIIETTSATPNVDLGADFAFGVAIGAPADPVQELIATFPGGSNALAVPLVLADSSQNGSYVLNSSRPNTGFTALTFKKNGSTVTVSTSLAVALTTSDVLTLTGTTNAGVTGKAYLIKQ